MKRKSQRYGLNKAQEEPRNPGLNIESTQLERHPVAKMNDKDDEDEDKKEEEDKGTQMLPSEIARIILGHLVKEENPSEIDHISFITRFFQRDECSCPETFSLFLRECPSLAEVATLHKRGRKIQTKVGGKTLKDIIKEGEE